MYSINIKIFISFMANHQLQSSGGRYSIFIEKGFSNIKISAKIPCAESTVRNTLKNYSAANGYASKKRNGANRKTTAAEDRIIKRLAEKGYNPRLMKKCPMISRKQKAMRKNFAEQYGPLSIKKWGHVLFTDESKVNLISSDGAKYSWISESEAHTFARTNKP
ncbi:MAG: hypothetical protein EZS28_020910 [Streblomastix strix]|uniref:Transposable element Tc3 transposase n=1 Tax=Streblomastix strix TaxID=222440 RepID=A0A5J4VLU8_9EUKA|nr:MAG: hypothetical protein EZS28_020910 [Streblomastix strix]